jgi:hypothetical protein
VAEIGADQLPLLFADLAAVELELFLDLRITIVISKTSPTNRSTRLGTTPLDVLAI